jgi:hypothetical protein
LLPPIRWTTLARVEPSEEIRRVVARWTRAIAEGDADCLQRLSDHAGTLIVGTDPAESMSFEVSFPSERTRSTRGRKGASAGRPSKRRSASTEKRAKRYHAESNQEAFLVLGGECRLPVEGEERRLRAWDFFHSLPWTEHAFVGAGDRPCVILMVGAHVSPEGRYPVSELAARYGATWRRRHPIRSRSMRRPSGSGEGGRHIGPACPGARAVRSNGSAPQGDVNARIVTSDPDGSRKRGWVGPSHPTRGRL